MLKKLKRPSVTVFFVVVLLLSLNYYFLFMLAGNTEHIVHDKIKKERVYWQSPFLLGYNVGADGEPLTW